MKRKQPTNRPNADGATGPVNPPVSHPAEQILARFFALYAVRNSVLENYHAGKDPQSRTGDFSDVKVVTPDGEIPWKRVSRITEAEMRQLMLSIERGFLLCLVKIAEMQAAGAYDEWLADQEESLFVHGDATWDLPPDRWAERQMIVDRLRRDREEKERQTGNDPPAAS